MLRAPGWGLPVPEGFAPSALCSSSQQGWQAGKKSAGFQKTWFVFSLAAASGHNREAKEGKASHSGISGLAKGGKFSPRSSLTAQRPAGNCSLIAPQAAPECQDLLSFSSALWVQASTGLSWGPHQDPHVWQ